MHGTDNGFLVGFKNYAAVNYKMFDFDLINHFLFLQHS
jgi:hypothetical protein